MMKCYKLMDVFELSIVIKRPIEEAFAFLANLDNDVKWHSALIGVGKAEGIDGSPRFVSRF